MSDELENVALAALLHDTGKFWLHSQTDLRDKLRRNCREPTRHLSFRQCPSCSQEFKYAHAVLADAFFQDFVPQAFQKGRSYALYHHADHKKKGYLAKILSLADWLSSWEREEEESGGGGIPHLQPVFSSLAGRYPAPRDERKEWFFPISSLRPDSRESLFPEQRAYPAEDRKDKYDELWSEFAREMGRLTAIGDFWSYFDTLYHLLMKYTWCLPSAYWKAVPDVSLFDHLRTTCAIAISLYISGVADGTLDLVLADPKCLFERDPQEIKEEGLKQALLTERLSLIGGDVSGVQSFLYTLTSQGVAKGLKGRSFYLSLLTEVAARWLLCCLGLPITNLIYAGGGHFYILSNYRDKGELLKYQAELSRALLEYHRGDLYLALAQVPVAIRDFSPERFSQKWGEVGRELSRTKGRRFSELEPGVMGQELFSPGHRQLLTGDMCAICHREGATIPISEDPLGRKKCDLCDSFEDLGFKLREARYLLLRFGGTGPLQVLQTHRPVWQSVFAHLGVEVDGPLTQKELESKRGLEGYTVLSFNNTGFLDALSLNLAKANLSLSLGFTLLANITPWSKEGKVADFKDMAEAAEGVKRLGVLRMDVDNLGNLFQHGLKDRATLSRLASLSFLLRLFFEGYLNQVCNRSLHSKEGDRLYTIYSGGDDLFIVGSWDVIPQLASEIREEFRAFTCYNRNVTISGGIAVEVPKFPLYQFARLAKEALEDRAKERKERRHGKDEVVKDAIDFLGCTLGWEDFKEVEAKTGDFKSWVGEDKAPAALLHRLLSLNRHYQEELKEAGRKKRLPVPGQVLYGRWMWLTEYFLSRMAERMEDAQVKRGVSQLQKDLVLQPGFLQKAALAARWAELLLRKEERR